MAKKMVEKKPSEIREYRKTRRTQAGPSSAVYSMGLFGAAFYFFPHAVGLSGFVLAFLKTLIWPALLVYQLLSFFKL